MKSSLRIVRAFAGVDGPAGWVFGGRILGLTSGVATALLASRALGPDGRGLVVTYAAVQFLLANGLALGTGSAAYVTASRRTVPLATVVSGVWAAACGLGLVSALAAATALATGLDRLVLPDVPAPVLMLIPLGVAAQYVVLVLAQVAMGEGRVRVTLVAIAAAPILLLGATAIVAVASPDASTMITAYVAAWLTAAIGLQVGAHGMPALSLTAARQLVRVGRSAAIGDLMNALSYRSDMLLLMILSGPTAVGIYALAVQALEPVWVLAGSAASGLLIDLPKQEAASWKGRVAATTRRAVMATVVAVAAVLAAMPLIAAAAGAGFATTPLVALVLAPGIVLLAASKTLASLQLASGRLWWGSIASAVTVASNVAANLLLIPLLGAVGAAAASSTSYGVSLAAWVTAYRRPGS